MDRWGDHAGKSKTASSTHAEIAARARQLRVEQELKASATSRRLVEQARDQAGSVQR
jgi:hypothetical protein